MSIDSTTMSKDWSNWYGWVICNYYCVVLLTRSIDSCRAFSSFFSLPFGQSLSVHHPDICPDAGNTKAVWNVDSRTRTSTSGIDGRIYFHNVSCRVGYNTKLWGPNTLTSNSKTFNPTPDNLTISSIGLTRNFCCPEFLLQSSLALQIILILF